MKKFTAMLLCLVLLLSVFAGCGNETADPTTPGNSDPTLTEPTVAPTKPTPVPTDPTAAPTDPTAAPTGPTQTDPMATDPIAPNPTDPKPTQPKPTDPKPTQPANPWADCQRMNIGQLLKLSLASGALSTETYVVTATVESISNANYGAMWITDSTGRISVYNSKAADGTDYVKMADKPYAGDTVTLACTVQNFNGTMEIKQAYIIDFKHAELDININDYKKLTIAAARDTAEGTKVNVTGVVARITFANGIIPSGVILVDNTSSIYVFDSELAARCAIGNTITVCASKTYWILSAEESNAAKFGYKGCNQLEDATLISNDGKTSDFNKNWIKTTTVKDIVETPVSQDISTTIFKVTAQVVRQAGNGYVNYYFNDLDGTTGSYTYSQCNGKDFTWLDAYAGKICTVYLMAMNAKATASDCFWRFLPIAVIDENFDVSKVNIPEHVVNYYGLPQFLTSYSGDPALELVTSVDSELLKFTGAKLSYTSSDPSVIKFEGNVMHCLKSGTVTVTVTGSHGGKTYSGTMKITVNVQQSENAYPTVSDAIGAAVGNKVTVKGIVGPSLVNKTGFYLIDDTGVIAVETTAGVMSTLEIGYEVVLEANRGFNNNDGKAYGQTCLKDATVLINNYGSHAYSTKAFKGNITVQEFYNLKINTDYTTSVYTMKATVFMNETSYYTNLYLTDGTNKVNLYCSSAKQYEFLKAYAGQEITVEIAACNWNSKPCYTGCVLAVVNADGSKVLNTLNFN